MEKMQKPNSRSTKDAILKYSSYLENLIKKYEESLTKNKSNTPQKIIEDQKITERQTKIASTRFESLDSLVEMVKNLSETYARKLNELDLIEEEISFNKTQLENLYKLKIEAESCFALIESKEIILSDLETKIKQLDEIWENESQRKHLELISEMNQKRLKFKFEIEQEKMIFENYKEKETLKLETIKKDLEDQKNEKDKLYDEIASLQKSILMFENKKEKEITLVKTQLTDELKKEFEFEMQLMRSRYEKELAVSKCEIENLQNNLDDLYKQLELSSNNLKDSIQNITSIANKTVDNYHTEKSLENIKELMMNNEKPLRNKER